MVHPDFAPTLLDTNASEGKGRDGTLRVVLHPGATVKGRVYDADGKPQAGIVLRFQDRDGYSGFDDEKLGQLAHVTSDANGYYEADHLPAENCYVQRDDPWKSWGTVRQAILTMNGKTQILNFGGTTQLTGRLIVNGEPLASARVQLSGENPFFGIFKAFAKSDMNGAFNFWGTPPGKRTLYYTTDPQGQSWVHVKDVEVLQGNADLGDIECVSAKLTARINPATGGSIEGGSLHLQAFNPIWPFGNDAGKLEDRDNPNAPYVFNQVPPGQYELVYHRPGQFTVRQRVDISPSARQKSVTIKVPLATASLSGKLAPAICGPGGCRALNVGATINNWPGQLFRRRTALTNSTTFQPGDI